jgi:hypothetical protein
MLSLCRQFVMISTFFDPETDMKSKIRTTAFLKQIFSSNLFYKLNNTCHVLCVCVCVFTVNIVIFNVLLKLVYISCCFEISMKIAYGK